MRRFLVLATSLLLAACATAPKPAQVPVQPMQPPQLHSALFGLTAAELVQRFGTPALQIREGESLKLQFRNAQCVLDVYLYPTGQAPHRVTHVDTRSRAMAAIDQAFCIRSFEAP